METIENLNDLLDEPIKNESNKQKKSLEKKDIYNDDNKLIIGLNDKSKELFIPEKSRFLNTLVLGTKGTGKTTSVLPMFVEQDLKRKNAGVTIITSSKEMSYNLYSLAKKYKRKIHFIKPSINNEVTNKFLWLKDYNYDYINESIVNYKEAIKKKEVVIIDMEMLKYKSDALKAVAMLLLQLRLDIQETDITQRCHHFLYVDDAYNYLKFLEDLLIFSDNYNLGITLFMQSRNQLITNNKDFNGLINNNIRNTLLLNNITIEDFNYYKDKFFEKNNPNEFFNREFNTMLYETIDAMGVRRTGITKFKKLLIGDWDELEAKSKRIRTTLLKEKRKERELELKDKYLKTIESQKKEEVKKETVVEEVRPLLSLTKEPKPIDSKLIESLTSPKFEENTPKIKPRDFNIKKDTSKNNQIQAGAKPSFNPPKTNYDIELEHKTSKSNLLDLSKDLVDLGSIKPKQNISQSKYEKTENGKGKQETKNIKINEKKESLVNKDEKLIKEIPNKQESINPIEIQKQKETIKMQEQNNKQESINPIEIQKQKEKETIKIQEQNNKQESVNPIEIQKQKEKETIKIQEQNNKQESVNPIEIQKQKEKEAIKIQQKIEKKIQEQILNEEKERKRLVATRIFNNYNENIDYCDEVFDFKYE